jgi:hypothetical protein
MEHNEYKEHKKKQIQFYTMKFKSLRLKQFDYDIKITPREARENGEMISVFDNQFLRSIRKIKGQKFDEHELEELINKKNKLRNKLRKLSKITVKKESENKNEAIETKDNEAIIKNTEKNNEIQEIKEVDTNKKEKENNSNEELFENIEKEKDEISKELIEIQNKIDEMLFIEEYITIVMEHKSHYQYLFENGIKINNKRYIRVSCSASQSRVGVVTFAEENVAKELKKIIDNGRNTSKKFSPSKLNAYIGLGSSATQIVSTPRFCVIPDYHSKAKVKVNFVTETKKDEDDLIEEKEIEIEFNRFDGMGLISYEKADEWAKELGLDYVPSQWCVRQSFLKGMLCTFPILDFCKLKNQQNFNIKTSYKDENGNDKIVNLNDIDVICTESQFKLWDSYNSLEEYIENCEKNKLYWGVSLYSPKQDKDILNMNYQFLQTLNLDKSDISKLCKKSVDWIKGVCGEDIYYTLLFLLGEEITEERIQRYLKNSDNYWVKSLIVNHELIKDKYIKDKIYDLIKKRIKSFCLGGILVSGNFQVLVSDPYAFMQHACGQPVTGLLKEREYYSNYWNKKGINLVDSMRAPLTYRSEHLKLPLIENEDAKNWYKYCESGIIVNVHGFETLCWAGSDYDFDIIATTSDEVILNGVYENELPVVYDAPKPVPTEITDEKLYESDLFSFGSIIGSITNKSTSGYALLPLLKENTEEYNITMNRIKMCTKLQSAQIDKILSLYTVMCIENMVNLEI